MTNEQIERSVEIKSNAADNALMNGRMSQVEYDFHMRALNRWADARYAKVRSFAEQDGQGYSPDYHWS